MANYLKSLARRLIGQVAPLAWRTMPMGSLLILTYHRVLPADDPARRMEQPGMCVSPETLRMHIDVLREHFELVDLQTWLNRRDAGESLPARACCITFDDGWRDNFQHALPVLKQAEAPATIFLVAGLIGRAYAFWPNRLAALLRHAEGRAFEEPQRVALRGLGIDAAPVAAPFAERLERAIVRCKREPDAAIIARIEVLERELNVDAGGRDLLDAAEITALRDSGLVRFGSHTVNHTRLIKGLDPGVLRAEVEASRAMLEALSGQAIEVFCYPNGDHSEDAVSAVRRSYRAAVTTVRGWNQRDSDPYLLRRMSMHDDVTSDRASFLARISGLA